MGKSDKKIKSDRINALKKKYDAYLEEDRKRKERNEYILEKLDKMRRCNVLVQDRKSSFIDDSRKTASYNMLPQMLDSPSYHSQRINEQHFPSEIQYKHVDESVILQEISKKYILIPKLRCIHNSDYSQDMKALSNDNNDWKSKYEILEQLKKNEKEESALTPQPLADTYLLKTDQNNENISKAEINSGDKTQSNDVNNFLSKETLYYKNEEAPSKRETNIKDVDQNERHNDVHNENIKLIKNKNMPIAQLKQETIKLLDSNVNPDQDKKIIQPEAHGQMDLIENESAKEDISDAHERHIKDKMNNSTTNNNQDKYLEEEKSKQTIDHNNVVEEKNNEIVHLNNPEITEHTEYPVEIICVQDFTPRDDVVLEDGVNINPHQSDLQTTEDSCNYNSESIAFTDNVKLDNNFDPIVVSEDTDLAETAGMQSYVDNNDGYYNQQVDENYVYNEEGAVDNNYNTEYTVPNENYNQEEYAAYYEGEQTEQVYSIEANENDTATQRYDQNYQQQYDTDYNNAEAYPQQEYEQQYTQQSYGQNESTGQEVEQTLQETSEYNNQVDTVHFVEQVLDHEEGYITEKQNDEIETRTVEKPKNQQPSSYVSDEKVDAQ